MEKKFTQGRWNINKLIDGFSISSADDNQNLNIPVAQVFGTPNDFEGEANAKLIAAAPNMLNVIVEVFNQLKDPNFKTDEVNRIYCIGMLETVIKTATK